MTVKKYVHVILFLVLLTPLPIMAAEGEEHQDALSPYEKLVKTANEKGFAKVILKLKVKNIRQLTKQSTEYKTVGPGRTFPSAGIQADLDLEKAIHNAAFPVLHQLNDMDYRVNHTYSTLPYLALDVSSEVLSVLPSIPGVLVIYEDKPGKPIDYRKAGTSSKGPLENPVISPGGAPPMLETSTGPVGATDAWNMGYTGSGWYVAILDTGIRRTHQFFQGKIIKEACFSANHDCPNGNSSMIGTGAAAHYENIYDGFDHGTHVAGIAAGQYASLAGTAKNSNIIAVHRTITINNRSAVKPFGAIDRPEQGGIASGPKYRTPGWVLASGPNKIPEDGSTINVYVDGKYLGHATYNIYRADVAALFPGYANGNGALAYFDFDTTTFPNGVHTIHWTVTDNARNTDGIGNRYFTIQNTDISR